MNGKEHKFISGLDLSQAFHEQVIAPILRENVPQLAYSSALIGAGSEVLGFDTCMSSDHDWGPRLLLFLQEHDLTQYADEIKILLEDKLPQEFMRYPVRYGLSKADSSGERVIRHRVEIFSLAGFLKSYINVDNNQNITAADWLTIPEQKLRSITAGRVFHDQVGLAALRQKFAYYPFDVWLYLLASGWNRIEQEEHLMGRAGIAGDEIGSSLIAARLVRDVMRLCFLMEKRYAPYAKWFGTAFAQLACGPALIPKLQAILCATSWNDREKNLSTAYTYVANMHNRLEITAPLPIEVSQFHDRPFRVISKGVFSEEIASKITDPEIHKLVSKRLIGSIDQISDNTDILEDPTRRISIKDLYRLD